MQRLWQVKVKKSDIEVAHELGVLLDELAARLDLVAHEDREELIGFLGILHLDAQHRAALGIHGRFPELLRIHLAKAFVALDGNAVAADLVELARELVITVGVPVLLALADLIERRLSDVDMAVLDERLHVAVEEGQAACGCARRQHRHPS